MALLDSLARLLVLLLFWMGSIAALWYLSSDLRRPIGRVLDFLLVRLLVLLAQCHEKLAQAWPQKRVIPPPWLLRFILTEGARHKGSFARIHILMALQDDDNELLPAITAALEQLQQRGSVVHWKHTQVDDEWCLLPEGVSFSAVEEAILHARQYHA